ncbi:MAG TPA: YiiX/YebB-like N1pC/P60 family cysteine hydrolase [Burkholderiales bacterium]|nr:YiiX/YebB-like N1pC/P60 family cysteine hydrolase [Burkholderiales bacterium]
MWSGIGRSIGRAIGRYLSQPVKRHQPFGSPAPLQADALRPGDVVLVEGDTRVSGAIKYLTQSTWSHAALYIGDALSDEPGDEDQPVLIEADMVHGVCAVPLRSMPISILAFAGPVGLAPPMRSAWRRTRSLGWAIPTT